MIGEAGIDGFDVVEVAPLYDGVGDPTSVLAAALIVETIGGIAHGKKAK